MYVYTIVRLNLNLIFKKKLYFSPLCGPRTRLFVQRFVWFGSFQKKWRETFKFFSVWLKKKFWEGERNKEYINKLRTVI